MKTFTTRASREAVARWNLEVVGETTRIANDSAECLGLPATTVGDIHPTAVPLVRIPVEPAECHTQLGRLLAETIDHAKGTILVTCLTKTELDKDINGHRPGTPEHAELAEKWGIQPDPILSHWDGWTNICRSPDFETGAQYFDRMAHAIAGRFIGETFTVEIPRPLPA